MQITPVLNALLLYKFIPIYDQYISMHNKRCDNFLSFVQLGMKLRLALSSAHKSLRQYDLYPIWLQTLSIIVIQRAFIKEF